MGQNNGLKPRNLPPLSPLTLLPSGDTDTDCHYSYNPSSNYRSDSKAYNNNNLFGSQGSDRDYYSSSASNSPLPAGYQPTNSAATRLMQPTTINQAAMCNYKEERSAYNSKFARYHIESYKQHDRMRWNFDFDHNKPLDNSSPTSVGRFDWDSPTPLQ